MKTKRLNSAWFASTPLLQMVALLGLLMGLVSCNDKTTDGPNLSKLNVYLILDGSGSGQVSYAVPKVDVPACERLIDSIAYRGGGFLYVNYVDADGNNNKAAVMPVPAIPAKPILRERIQGELSFQYDKVIEQFKNDSVAYQAIYAKAYRVLATAKNEYLPDIEQAIAEAYRPKSSAEDFSDIIGVLNTANKSLQAAQDGKKVILAFSDLEQSLPRNVKSKTLKPLPKDISIVRVNGSDSGEKVYPVTVEVDNFEVALKSVFN